MNEAALSHPCTERRRTGGRPRGRVGPVRAALLKALADGVSGPMDVLAAHIGWPPDRVRQTIYNMRVSGDLPPPQRAPQPGRRGQPPGLYGLPAPTVDALAHVQQVWR